MVSAQAVDATRMFTLEEAVDFALKNYPAIRVSAERVSGAQAGVNVTRTEYLPRLDMLWQGNRATRNNTFGLLFPQSTIPSISGPVLPTTSNEGVWGSAAGLLFSWEPFDFGRRGAEVSAARAVQSRTSAEVSVTRLDVAIATVNAYLTLLAAEQGVRVAQADVDRRQIFAQAVNVLVANQLRAGADGSRANAEAARAKASLARAQQQQEISRAALADILGTADARVEVRGDPLVGPPPDTAPPTQPIKNHPLATAQQLRIDEFLSRAKVFERSYYPKFDFESALYGRGTGANADGTLAGGATGLDLQRSNWAVGLTVTFAAFDIFSLRAKKDVELANERAEAARYDQTLQDLTGQMRKAQASLEGARHVAEETPVELKAAQDTEVQERVRYQAGLATIVEVSEAQSLLVQAEIDNVLARLAVWQNLAGLAASQGDLGPFMQMVRQKTQGGP